MTAPSEDVDLQYIDGRNTRLFIAVDLDGSVHVHHHEGDGRDLGADLAEMVDDIRRDLHVRVIPPTQGRSVLACSGCGAIVDRWELRWLPPLNQMIGFGDTRRPRLRDSLPRVGCSYCARAAG